MHVKQLRSDLQKRLLRYRLTDKFEKQRRLFESDANHPSLNTELLAPKKLRIYSFRVDRKYRAIFIIVENEAEIIDVNNHYQ